MQTAPSQGWTSWASLGAPAAAGGLNRPAVAQAPTGASKSSPSVGAARYGTSGRPASTAAGRRGPLPAPRRAPLLHSADRRWRPAQTDAWNCSSAATTTRCGLAGRPQRRLVTVDLPRPSAIHQPAVSGRRVEHTGFGAELRRTPRTVRRGHEHRAVAHLADRPQSGMVGVAVARQPTRIQDIRTVILKPESSAHGPRSRLPGRLIR